MRASANMLADLLCSQDATARLTSTSSRPSSRRKSHTPTMQTSAGKKPAAEVAAGTASMPPPRAEPAIRRAAPKIVPLPFQSTSHMSPSHMGSSFLGSSFSSLSAAAASQSPEGSAVPVQTPAPSSGGSESPFRTPSSCLETEEPTFGCSGKIARRRIPACRPACLRRANPLPRCPSARNHGVSQPPAWRAEGGLGATGMEQAGGL
mmetsp:Transcript_39554/g.112179  ORF Transcript_39554/g.112179 Transcript_39554/m.112179 type:complete len:206 (+) Transcript_39554:1162-1779(+)